jgi:hypothetical protein
MQINTQTNNKHTFRTYASEIPDSRTWQEIVKVAEDEQEVHDLAKLTPPFSDSISSLKVFNSRP